jgi:hypothetical protein
MSEYVVIYEQGPTGWGAPLTHLREHFPPQNAL